jgi:uncharacterized protein (DUF2147 family)
MTHLKSTLTFVLGLALAGAAFAQASPVGLWKTIDDETGQAKSLVRISESGGVLSGRIEKLLAPKEPNPVCDKCSDARKDQPITGMTIFSGPRRSADDPAIWEGGEILDPNNGKSYRMRIRMVDDRTLELRGYVAFFYRSQQWQRAE